MCKKQTKLNMTVLLSGKLFLITAYILLMRFSRALEPRPSAITAPKILTFFIGRRKMKALKIIMIIFVSVLPALSAIGQNFTLSDKGLMTLDWSSGSSDATLIDRTDVPGPGVLFHIYFPDNEQPDSVFRYLSCESGGAGLLSGLDVSMYDAFELKFTIVSIDGISTPDIGGLISVGAVIDPYDGSTSAYQPAWIDLVSGMTYNTTAISSTSVKTDRTSLLGIFVWLFNPSDWNPSGTNLILLVEPAPGAVPIRLEPAIIYVDVDAKGLNDGSSWDDAFTDLQSALIVAEKGDEIRVARGVYTPEDPLLLLRASNPNPMDGSFSVSTNADLSWMAGSEATSHDVYFGTTSPGMFMGNQTATTFDPGTMAYYTTYYWRIDEINQGGKTTGAVWSFTTLSSPPPPPPLANSNEQTASAVIDRTATFQLKNGVVIKGGYAGFGEPDPNERDIELYETILSGDLAGNDEPNFVNYEENSYHVVTGSNCDQTAILDGFTIAAGNANGYDADSVGGGMFNLNSNPTLTNCTFSGNWATDSGGAMSNLNSSPALTNCTFSENSTPWAGGGMDNCDIDSNPTLANCTFSGNSAEVGGGMCNYNCSPILTNCTFSGNSANWEGGGMINWDNSNPTVTNCTFSGNLAGDAGGGMSNKENSNPTLTNCILWGNESPYGAQIYNDGASWTTISYSCVQGYVEPNETPPTVGLISHWKFDEGEGSIAYDSAGENHGTLINNPTWTTGQVGGALSFGGEDSVKIPGFGNIAPTSEITVGMWVKLGQIRNQDLFSLDPFEPRPQDRITIHLPWGNDIHWQFGEPFEGLPIPLSSGITGIWEHYAFVASSSGNFMKIYRNGVEAASKTGMNNFVRASADGHIAGSRPGAKFIGTIDDVRIYDRALYAEEIRGLLGLGSKGGGMSNKENSSPTLTNCILWDNEAPDGAQIYNDGASWTTIGYSCVQGYVEPNETPPTEGLISHWKFDEGQGETAYDSASSNHGTIYGGAEWTTGIIGGSLFFNGYDNYVSLPIGSVISSLTNTTITTWVNRSGGGSWERCWDFGSGESVNMFLTTENSYIGTPRFAITISGSNNEDQVTAPDYLYEGWHHLAVTIDAQSSTHSLYIDGESVAQNTSARYTPSDLGSTTQNWLGRSQYSWDPYLAGRLDDVRIYNKALSTEEIRQLFRYHPGGQGNIVADPCFVNPNSNDFHLLPSSPCINEGDPDYIAEPNEIDLDGKPRIIAGRIDMGAYEFNHTPVADAGLDQAVEAQAPWGAVVTLDGSGSSDDDSTPGTIDDITDFNWYLLDPCDPNADVLLGNGQIIDCNLPIGEHIILLEVIDRAGAADTNEVIIIVQDTNPPDINCPPDVILEWPADTTPSATGKATATDTCGDVNIRFRNRNIPGCGNTETIERTWIATDEYGNSSSCVQVITVVDTAPPQFELSVEPTMLWPPDHKMYEITPNWSVSDECDPDPNVSFVSIVANEGDDIIGDGHTTDDIQIGDDGSIFVRSERSGPNTGRIYTITYQAVDDCGNVTVRNATVSIPHELKLLARMGNRWLWRNHTGSLPEDLNGDGIVNLVDFARFAGNWTK